MEIVVPPGDTGEFLRAARAARQARDFDTARRMYQKAAYAASVIREPGLKKQVNAMLRDEQARYVVDDPLFHAVLSAAMAVIRAEPGILQSRVYGRLSYPRDLVQWALYYGEVLGQIQRERKGRSYALSVPEYAFLKPPAPVPKIPGPPPPNPKEIKMRKEDRSGNVARGIAREKNRESLSVLMVLGAALVAWIIGSATEAWIGVAAMLLAFRRIWKFYAG